MSLLGELARTDTDLMDTAAVLDSARNGSGPGRLLVGAGLNLMLPSVLPPAGQRRPLPKNIRCIYSQVDQSIL